MDSQALAAAVGKAEKALALCRSLEAALARAEEMRGKVRPAAFAKVQVEYQEKLAAARKDLEGHRKAAGAVLDRSREALPGLHERADRLEEERDEIVLRGHLGEIPDAPQRAAALEAQAAELRRQAAAIESATQAAVSQLGIGDSVQELVASLASLPGAPASPGPGVPRTDLTDVVSGGTLHFASGTVRQVGFGRILIGAADDANIVIRDASVRPRHAAITFENGRHVVSAIDGTILVDGRPCTEAVLSDGSRIAFGDVEVAFRTSFDGPALASQATPSGTAATVLTTRSQVEMAIAQATASGKQDTFVINRPLLLIHEGGRTRTVRLDLGQTQVGSAADDDIRIEGIRPHHAVVRFAKDGFAVLAEAGPVQVNGRHVRNSPLADGDVIRLGSVEIQYAESSFRDA